MNKTNKKEANISKGKKSNKNFIPDKSTYIKNKVMKSKVLQNSLEIDVKSLNNKFTAILDTGS